jgi:hypothetical protein
MNTQHLFGMNEFIKEASNVEVKVSNVIPVCELLY